MEKLFEGFRPLEAEELVEWVGGATKSKATIKAYKSPKGQSSTPTKKLPPKKTSVQLSGGTDTKLKKAKYAPTPAKKKPQSNPVSAPIPKPEIPEAMVPSSPLTETKKRAAKSRPETSSVSLEPKIQPQLLRPTPVAQEIPQNPKPPVTPSSTRLTQEMLDTQPLGEILDARYLGDEQGGYCLVGALLQTYEQEGAELDVKSLVKIMKTAATTDSWNGNPVVESNGYVNDPDQFLALAARVLQVQPLSTGDVKFREPTLSFALAAENSDGPGALNFTNGQAVFDAFREQGYRGQEGSGNIIVELRNGARTHFVSASNWDWSSIVDPHGGSSRSDWTIRSLRVLN